MEYLFLLFDLKDRYVLVVGGGDVAARKICLLKRAGARIKVVAYSLCSELEVILKNMCDVTWIGTTFTPSMLDDVFLVIVAIDDTSISDFVYQCAERCHKFINVVDDQRKCSFIFPAVIDRSPIVVGISSCGRSPVLVRILRETLESLLPNFLGPMASLLGNWRERVKHRILHMAQRRRFWEKILRNNSFITLISAGLFKEAEKFLDKALLFHCKRDTFEKLSMGGVSLVGAGPGDSGLFTLRGLQLVQEADVVLYDCLVSVEVLDLVRRDAKKICVGKRGVGKSFMKQQDINHLLISLAKAGKRVVRLKGGDPCIFGRGGEELEAVVAAGVPCQVIPGVTSASAAICAGIPLTHRHYSHSVTFITGHVFCNSAYKQADFHFLSYTNQTLVIYMGMMYVKQIYNVLVASGCDVNTPVAIISHGACSNQKVIIGTLNNLKQLVRMANSPSLLIIGRVVELHRKAYWLNQENIVNRYKLTSLINLF
ncbi:siroheme synthase CysG [Blochmannia endosymbiont of Polyrhachis (Hedomyrma) turneri]|uniref:siroheme synthase CysG n=1 Tax=Blochmannia endosymbiont of Polyrhachis (Hedomyrma) turneri TaxID=1505596 RepID=UPI00061A789F|nr:siroheme synthase CysG [Blochmannia endosymbiont of Polyrhachis (Hedomyrma) turneri]AKC59745.1 siroheme synthase [Blochmannia endosymbiont of Polyrhachis (Hedomyrma) turneri]